MKERLLYSNIWPLLTKEGDKTIETCFMEEIKKSDQLEIAVGFSSCNTLQKLDELITQQKIKNVSLILGMYYFEGFPETFLNLALEINNRWQKYGIGEIRVIHSFRYHGKLYCFLKNNEINSAMIGSPNLSFLTRKYPDKLEWRQYEIALLTSETETLSNIKSHIQSLKSEDISKNISFLVKNRLLMVIKSVKKEYVKIPKINS